MRLKTPSINAASGSLKASSLTRSLEALDHTLSHRLLPHYSPSTCPINALKASPALLKNATVSYVLPSQMAGSSGQPKTHPQAGPILIPIVDWWPRHTPFQDENYHFEIKVNWLGDVSEEQVREQFNRLRNGKTEVKTKVFEQIPRRFWERLIEFVGIPDHLKWAQLPKDKETSLIQELIAGRYSIQGKTTNKDEFVTCGGGQPQRDRFQNYGESSRARAHFAGECLDIDGITGGYNFQAAWTGGRLAGLAMANQQE